LHEVKIDLPKPFWLRDPFRCLSCHSTAYAKANATNDGQNLSGDFRYCRSLSLIARVKSLNQSVFEVGKVDEIAPRSGKVEIDFVC